MRGLWLKVLPEWHGEDAGCGAGKLDVCNTACTYGGGDAKTTESPGEVAGWGGHWELM